MRALSNGSFRPATIPWGRFYKTQGSEAARERARDRAREKAREKARLKRAVAKPKPEPKVEVETEDAKERRRLAAIEREKERERREKIDAKIEERLRLELEEFWGIVNRIRELLQAGPASIDRLFAVADCKHRPFNAAVAELGLNSVWDAQTKAHLLALP